MEPQKPLPSELEEIKNSLPNYFVDSSQFRFDRKRSISSSKKVNNVKKKGDEDSLFIELEYNVHPDKKTEISNFQHTIQLLSSFNIPVISSMYGYSLSDKGFGYIYIPFILESLENNFGYPLNESNNSNKISILLGLAYGAKKFEEKGLHPSLDPSLIFIELKREDSLLKRFSNPVISFWENCEGNKAPDFHNFGVIMWKLVSYKSDPNNRTDFEKELPNIQENVSENYLAVMQQCLQGGDGLTWSYIFENICNKSISFREQNNSIVDPYASYLQALMPNVDDFFNVPMEFEQIKERVKDFNQNQLQSFIEEVWHRLI